MRTNTPALYFMSLPVHFHSIFFLFLFLFKTPELADNYPIMCFLMESLLHVNLLYNNGETAWQYILFNGNSEFDCSLQ